MVKYIVEGCSDGLEYIVSASTVLSPLQVIDFNFGEDTPICGTVISETDLEPIPLYTHLNSYTDCLSCVQENNFSFSAIDCNFPVISGEVSSLYFTEFPVGKFYKFCVPDFFNPEIINCFCLEILGISPNESIPFPVEVTGPFNSCSCESPRSANTESNICLEICTESGTTVVSVTPPHPEWTDGYGTQVTELNMITLGGMNGLNN
jgi:hypothetical protein